MKRRRIRLLLFGAMLVEKGKAGLNGEAYRDGRIGLVAG
jgi:hypothetical protein